MMTQEITIGEIVRLHNFYSEQFGQPTWQEAERIAAKAIALDKVNKELIKAIKEMSDYDMIIVRRNGYDFEKGGKIYRIAQEALTKARAL